MAGDIMISVYYFRKLDFKAAVVKKDALHANFISGAKNFNCDWFLDFFDCHALTKEQQQQQLR